MFFKIYLQQRYEWVKSLTQKRPCTENRLTVYPFPLNRHKCQAPIAFSLSLFFISTKSKRVFILVESLPLSLCLSALRVSHRKDICLILIPFIQIVLPLLLYKYKDHSFVKWIYMNFFLSPVECSTINPGHFNLGINIKVMLEMVNLTSYHLKKRTLHSLSWLLYFPQNNRNFGLANNLSTINKKLLQKI